LHRTHFDGLLVSYTYPIAHGHILFIIVSAASHESHFDTSDYKQVLQLDAGVQVLQTDGLAISDIDPIGH
jgi:hypothetical protein